MKRNWKKNTPLVILSILMRKFSFLAILDMFLIWKWIWLWNDIIYTFVNQSFSIVEANIFLMYNPSSQYWFSFLDFSLALEKTKMTLFAYRFTIFGLTSFQPFSLRASNVARSILRGVDIYLIRVKMHRTEMVNVGLWPPNRRSKVNDPFIGSTRVHAFRTETQWVWNIYESRARHANPTPRARMSGILYRAAYFARLISRRANLRSHPLPRTYMRFSIFHPGSIE